MIDLWSPVVFGRTRDVDRWWRAVPAGLLGDPAGDMRWLRDQVESVIGGGRDLRQRPRHLLAQNARWRLVGVACMAARLDETMSVDTGSEAGRPLYTFVGFVARLGATGFPAVPGLAAWRSDGERWVSATYTRWVGLDWTQPQRRLTGPHASDPEPAPWPEPGVVAASLPLHADRLVLAPAADADLLWQAAAGSDRPVTVTAGWASARAVSRRMAMYATADDVTHLTEIAPDQPIPPPPGARQQAGGDAPRTDDIAPPVGGESWIAWFQDLFDRQPPEPPPPAPTRQRRPTGGALGRQLFRSDPPDGDRRNGR